MARKQFYKVNEASIFHFTVDVNSYIFLSKKTRICLSYTAVYSNWSKQINTDCIRIKEKCLLSTWE